MSKYYIIENGPVQFIWDEKRRQMFKIDGDGVIKVNGNLINFVKFNPLAILKRIVIRKPKIIQFNELLNRARKLGIKIPKKYERLSKVT